MPVMRTVVSFVAFLVICLAPYLNAQDLQVIKDSETAQYVGKNVEVRGLVVAVYTSKNGNTFINFGAKYPNQTFVGYIPNGSELAGDRRTSTLQGKVIGITGAVELYNEKPQIKVLVQEADKNGGFATGRSMSVGSAPASQR